jgi:hypothetical protein
MERIPDIGSSMQRLKVFIDPKIKETFGPEVCWVWRLLLSSSGYLWEEVPLSCSECDIAYLADLERPLKARVKVQANLHLWEQKSRLKLQKVEATDGLLHPMYYGEHDSPPMLLVTDGCLICERDIIFDVFWSVTAQEEKYWPKDRHGFFSLNGTAFLREKALRLAPASAIGCWLEKKMLKLMCFPPQPRWPYKKEAAASLSHDVDYPEVRRVLEPIRLICRQGLSKVRPAISVLTRGRDYWNFSAWAELEKSYEVKSAFYFSAQKGSIAKYACGTPDPFYDIRSDRFKEVFKYLTDEGFEIGLHASYWAFRNQEKFANEKALLQEASGQEIGGNRHHYWHLNPGDIEDTLLLHERIGLKYDTSLIHERYIGWRRGLSWPFFPFHQKERRELKTLQIPSCWMDNQLFGYLDHNPGGRFEILHSLIHKAAEQGGCLLVDVHDYVFDDTLFPGWSKTYRWLVEALTNRSDFWIGTPGQIADHWIKRYHSITDESHGLTLGLQ